MDHADEDPERCHDQGTPVAAARDVEASQATVAASRSDLDFAVVVGVEHYPHFRPLCGAINDARNFRDWLCDKEGGGLDPEHVKLIESNPEAKSPVQDEIDDILLEILEAAEARGGARRLYFYFSGHGATNPRSVDDVALLLTRWRTSLARLALSTQHYSRKLRGAGLFEELAMFIDCCRSLSVSVVGVEPTITREWERLRYSTRTFIAYATEAGQPAFEYPEPDAWQGIFTRCLLAILRREPSGVRARALKDFLEREVEEAARHLPARPRRQRLPRGQLLRTRWQAAGPGAEFHRASGTGDPARWRPPDHRRARRRRPAVAKRVARRSLPHRGWWAGCDVRQARWAGGAA